MDNPTIDAHRLLQITPGLIDPTAPYSSIDHYPAPSNTDYDTFDKNTFSVKRVTKSSHKTHIRKPFSQRLRIVKPVPVPEPDCDDTSTQLFSYEEVMCEKLDKYLQTLKSLRSDLQRLRSAPYFNVPLFLKKTRLCSLQYSPPSERKILKKKPMPRTPSVPTTSKFMSRRGTSPQTRIKTSSENTTSIFRKEGIQSKYIAVFPKVPYRRITPFTAREPQSQIKAQLQPPSTAFRYVKRGKLL